MLPTSASDVERYDIWRDEVRLDDETVDEGCALVLTNAPGFWAPPTRPGATGYDAFRVHEGPRCFGLSRLRGDRGRGHAGWPD